MVGEEMLFYINNVSWQCFVVRVHRKSCTFAANFQICNFMIYFFRTPAQSVIATQVNHELSADETNELCWLYGGEMTSSAQRGGIVKAVR